MYFIDTGLLCFLLSIRTPGELTGHPSYGNIFETFIISEFYKRILHIGEIPPLYYWRDRTGLEVDLIVETGATALAIEIKSAKRYLPDFEKSIKKWFSLPGNNSQKGTRPHPLIAGSCGCYGAYLANASEYTGAYRLTEKQYIDFHRPRVELLMEAGCDFIAFEIFPRVDEAEAAALMIKDYPGVKAWITFTVKNDSEISSGEPVRVNDQGELKMGTETRRIVLTRIRDIFSCIS